MSKFDEIRKAMLQKYILLVMVLGITGCAGDSFKESAYENRRAYDMPAEHIVDTLQEKLPAFLKATSDKPPFVQVKRDDTGVLLLMPYKPKDSSYTQCFVAKGRPWGSKTLGLEYGVIAVVLTPGAKGTLVRIKSAFDENRTATVAGKVVGHVSSPYGTGVVRDTKEIDIGSHCYSTGVIERSIFDLVESGQAVRTKVTDQLDEALVLNEEFFLNGSGDGSLESYMERVRTFDASRLNNAVNSTMNPRVHFSARTANNLGILHAKGQIFSKNEKTAFRLFEKAATADSPGEPDGKNAATGNLSIMYARGFGTVKNEAKALELLKSAARYDLDAQTRLGFFQAKGMLGLEKDELKAAQLFGQVVMQKSPKSQPIALRNLGYMFASGMGVKQNNIAAYTCYKLLAFGGEAKAQRAADVVRARLAESEILEANVYLNSDAKFKNYLLKNLY